MINVQLNRTFYEENKPGTQDSVVRKYRTTDIRKGLKITLGWDSIFLVALGTRYLMRMLRGYGVTFLIIQGYTLYFWHVAGEFGKVLGTAVAGASALWLVFWFEKQRKEKQV